MLDLDFGAFKPVDSSLFELSRPQTGRVTEEAQKEIPKVVAKRTPARRANSFISVQSDIEERRINNGQQSVLLRLPQELRDEIIRFAVQEPGKVVMDGHRDNRNPFVFPTVLQVCYQLRHEAAPIFWSDQAFVLYHLDHNGIFRNFVNLDPEHKRMLKKIRIINRTNLWAKEGKHYAAEWEKHHGFPEGSVWMGCSWKYVKDHKTGKCHFVNAVGDKEEYDFDDFEVDIKERDEQAWEGMRMRIEEQETINPSSGLNYPRRGQ